VGGLLWGSGRGLLVVEGRPRQEGDGGGWVGGWVVVGREGGEGGGGGRKGESEGQEG
jgi:hypothetical protein